MKIPCQCARNFRLQFESIAAILKYNNISYGRYAKMSHMENWIWLDPAKYPENQTSIFSAVEGAEDHVYTDNNYSVAEFIREYDFGCKVVELSLRVSGDTEFRLDLNGRTVLTGPANVGGDFLFNGVPRSKHYATELTLTPDCDKLSFFARVKMMPVAINEYSRGHGGFMLSARARLSDGSVKFITTDKSWQARLNRAFTLPYRYDQSLDTEIFAPAAEIDNIWHCETSPIKPRTEELIKPVANPVITLLPGEKKDIDVEFDMIHGGFIALDIKAAGPVDVTLDCIETDVSVGRYELHFSGNDTFRGLQLISAGLYRITAVNNSAAPAEIVPAIIATYYPVFSCANTTTSDKDLNLVLDVCRHTLKYCRQMIHLDSPKHSEPLACTGDYYIESLMTAMSYGDMDLAKFDIVRTAELLRVHDGRMFHTTYSLIWVMMLWDVYRITGDKQLLIDCEDALHLLMDRFRTYMGENGLIETPPDYMFVDWIYIDEISMHHPPKALGQTCLCAFYHGALIYAAKIYAALDDAADAAACESHAADLRAAMNALLYDPHKGLFFDGLNTPTPEDMLYKYLPQNVEKRYYMPHSNILCSLYGVCDDDTARRLIRKVVNEPEWGACQPYFMHFLLEAIFRLGLTDELTLKVVENWKAPIKDCPRGLVEGFIVPEPTYSFDHSHAWGGTPLYSVPRALLGLDILEPGYKKIALKPTLLGLDSAHVEVPTPFGVITADLEKGKAPAVTVPDGVELA